jgi:MFS transporter, DHA1 family, multidrug resistance protein
MSGRTEARHGTAAASMSAPFVYGLAAALIVYGWLSVNIYLPVLPQLDRIFGTTSQTAKLTVTVFLLGFGLTQLVWGPLSDRVGRRTVLLAGLTLSVAGAAVAASTTNVYLFMAARFLEAVGIGACPVMARSIVADTIDRERVGAAMAYVLSVVALVPALAAILGGYIYLLSSWRTVFFFVALCGAGLLLLSFFRVPETLSASRPVTPSAILHGYVAMLRNGRYFAFVFTYCIIYGCVLGYYASAPYIFIDALGYSTHEYGYLLLVNAACYVLGASASRPIMRRSGPTLPLALALVACGTSILSFLVLELTSGMSTLGVLFPTSLFTLASGLVAPAANAGALGMFRDRAGASAAIIGCSITLGGALATAILSHFEITRLWQLALFLGVGTLINLGAYLIFLRGPAQSRNDAGAAGDPG